MSQLPSHVAETVQTTRTYQCLVCGSRITPGIYRRAGYAEEVLADWLAWHEHGAANDRRERPTP